MWILIDIKTAIDIYIPMDTQILKSRWTDRQMYLCLWINRSRQIDAPISTAT